MFKTFTKTKLTENDVAELLAHIPPPAPKTNSREYWLKIIAATCAALDGNEAAALALLKNWQEEWENNAYETAIKSLRGNYKSTAGTLVFLAKENGYNASEKAKERAAREHAPAAQKTAKTAPQAASAKQDTRNGKNGKKGAKRNEKANTPAPAARVLLGKCSIVESCRKPETVKETDLLACLRAIKAGKWKSEVEAVRAGTREKSTLPQICAFGVYSARRADENLMTKSGFLVLDYDGKDNPKTDFRKLRSRLAKLPFVLAVFKSPSGNGLKALIRIPDGANDGEAFSAAARVLAPLGGKLDTGTEARKHFIISYDSETFINETPLEEIPPLDDWENLSPAALAVIFAETVERFYFAGTEDYYFNDEGTIKKLSVSSAMQEFEVRHGANRKTAQKALYAVRKWQYVDRVFRALTCHRAGMCILDKKPVLVLSSPEIIEAEEGAFPTIKLLLETVWANEWEQLARFLAWFQISRRAFLRACESNGATVSPVPLLMFLGLHGSGKNLIFETLIKPALGNRNHASGKKFPQEKQWLGDIIGSECIFTDELKGLNTQERSCYKATIKQIISGSGYDAECKGKDSFNFYGQHFLVLSANTDDGGNCAASCPEISADFEDKFIALSTANVEAVKREFSTAKKEENAAAIRRELPAFLYWLENYFDFPQEWKDDRFGVAHYCAPAAAQALFEIGSESELLERLQIMASETGTKLFDGKKSATEISEMLRIRFSATWKTVPLGKALKKLCERYPEFIKNSRTGAGSFYEFSSAGNPAYKKADSANPASAETESPFFGLAF